MSHVDLHLHLLPGVDDGPADQVASLAHAERMAAAGVHEATVTPHVGHPDFPLDVHSIPERTRALEAAIEAAGIELRLHPGGEIHPDGATALTRDELDVIAHGPRGARWVLLEVPFAGVDAAFLEACRHVRRQGFALLIAHPERAAGLLAGGLEMLRPVLEDGALLQVNVCSLLGRQGPEAHAAAARLVRDGLAYVLASDGHGRTRRHTLAEGQDAARRAGASALRSRQLTGANPRFLLQHGIPMTPHDERGAWHAPHERRVRAAIAAARSRITR
jgi:protein-tyrosine phosphatase